MQYVEHNYSQPLLAFIALQICRVFLNISGFELRRVISTALELGTLGRQQFIGLCDLLIGPHQNEIHMNQNEIHYNLFIAPLYRTRFKQLLICKKPDLFDVYFRHKRFFLMMQLRSLNSKRSGWIFHAVHMFICR